jgi:flagellar biosynthesis protein FlhG
MNTIPAESRPPVSRNAANPRNLIAVASGKGGVGKTWFSITLVHALARAGRRALLFDADLGLANVDIQLGLMPPRDLGAVLAGRITLSQAVFDYEPGGFGIIAGRSGMGSLASLPANRLVELGRGLADLASDYDYVVMDLGAGLERTVRQFTAQAGICLVVTTDEPTALTDAYAFIKVTLIENPGSDLRLVVNLAANRREGERTFGTLRKACQGFLKFTPPLAGIVRRDSRVKDSIRNQTALLTRYPNGEAATDVEAIAMQIDAKS